MLKQVEDLILKLRSDQLKLDNYHN